MKTGVIIMRINEIINQKGMTKYSLSKTSGVPHATLNDICSGKTKIEKCSAETIYKISHAQIGRASCRERV